jgi:putative ABC transport system permease protein
VVYNSARIALSEREPRAREPAGARLHPRRDRPTSCWAKSALLTLLAIPLGLLFGLGLSGYLAVAFSSDLYRIPLIVSPATYALAATIVLVSFLITAALIWRKLGRLDLVEVLKTRE